MTLPPTTAIHHLRLTVSDIARARAFYTGVLGLEVAAELPPGVLLTNGSALVGLRPVPEETRPRTGDRFDENRVGLDHVSFGVNSRGDLERAAQQLDELGVRRGEIADMPDRGISVLPFRDPDNIQLELTAPYA